MNGISVLLSAFQGAHFWFTGTVAGLTDEQANAMPPGVAAPISWLIAHVAQSEDHMLNVAVRERQSILMRDGWDARVGPMQLTQDTLGARAYRCDLATVLEYTRAVFGNTEAVLAEMTDADLDRVVDVTALGFPPNLTVGQFLTFGPLGNTYAHTGEMSALKGMIGLKGYPF